MAEKEEEDDAVVDDGPEDDEHAKTRVHVPAGVSTGNSGVGTVRVVDGEGPVVGPVLDSKSHFRR